VDNRFCRSQQVSIFRWLSWSTSDGSFLEILVICREKNWSLYRHPEMLLFLTSMAYFQSCRFPWSFGFGSELFECPRWRFLTALDY
jgi:hypothetical protein